MDNDLSAKIDLIPIRQRRVLARYLVDRERPTDIAESEGMSVTTIYKWIENAEKICGVPIKRHTKPLRTQAAA